MKGPLITIICALIFSSTISAAESFLDYFQNFNQSLDRLERHIHSNSRVIQRAGHRSPILSWKEDAIEALSLLTRQSNVFLAQLEQTQRVNAQIPSQVLERRLKIIENSLIEVLTLLDRDQYPHQVYVLAAHLRESFQQMLDLSQELLHYQPQAELSQLVELREIEITFRSPTHVCQLLSMPGDISLRRSITPNGEDDFSERVMRWIRFLERMKGGSRELHYRHAEFITKLESAHNIETLSYYPWQFTRSDEDSDKPMFLRINNQYHEYALYRTSFSVYRVNAASPALEFRKKEMALARARLKKTFIPLGTCADFVNWLYFGQIRSDWNRVPLVRKVVAGVYLPEAIDTPDNLAESNMTAQVCHVQNAELIFPQKVMVAPLLERLLIAQNSSSEKIRNHSSYVLQFLRDHQVISQDNQRLAEIIALKDQRTDFIDSFLDAF